MIDSHVHIWDARRFPMTWLARYPEVADLCRLDDLMAEAGDAAPDRLVLVQAGTTLPGLRWLLGEARRERRVAAVVASAPSRDPAAVRRWIGQARRATGGELLRGVRVSGLGEDADFFRRPAAQRLIETIAELGLVPCLLADAAQLVGIAEAAAAGAGEPLVVDHLGAPPLGKAATPRALATWRAGISAIAGAGGVVVKLSGSRLVAPEHAGEAEAVVDHAFQELGPGRLMIGSDWPMTTPILPYPAVVARIQELAQHVDADADADRIWATALDDVTFNH